MLFTFTGGTGHLEPLLPLAIAARTAGHVVAFAGRPSAATTAEAVGFGVFATEARSAAPAERIPLRAPDGDREDRDLRDGFAGRLARARAAQLQPLCTAWRPDVLVCDEIDVGALVVAELLGMPYATVLVIASGAFVRPELVGPTLDELRAAHGLPPDPELELLRRHLVLSPVPPSFRDPAFPLPVTAQAFRPPMPAATPHDDGRPGRPARVYLTLGTVFNVESGDLLPRLLAGCASFRSRSS
jgi:UDP:flavonoid glycosyltransferase YjiC (YdhE family)